MIASESSATCQSISALITSIPTRVIPAWITGGRAMTMFPSVSG